MTAEKLEICSGTWHYPMRDREGFFVCPVCAKRVSADTLGQVQPHEISTIEHDEYCAWVQIEHADAIEQHNEAGRQGLCWCPCHAK